MVTGRAHEEDDGGKNDENLIINFREVAWERVDTDQASIPDE